MKTRMTSFTAVTILLASIVMLTVPAQVYAMPGPDSSIGSTLVAQGTQNTFTITPSTAQPTPFPTPHQGTIFVFEHGSPVTVLGFDTFVNCEAVMALGVGMVWALVDNTGALARYNIGPGDSIKVTFKDGTTNPSVVLNGPTASLTGAGHVWIEYTGQLAPADDGLIMTGVTVPQLQTLGNTWGFFTCGQDGVGNENQPGSKQDTFTVALPVGGEIISINNSALLIAGLMTNAIWIAPTIGVLAGAGLTLYKFRKNI